MKPSQGMVEISPVRSRQGSPSIRRRRHLHRQWPQFGTQRVIPWVVISVVLATGGVMLFCNSSRSSSIAGQNKRHATTNHHKDYGVHSPLATPATRHHHLRTTNSANQPHFDVIVVGSGLAGLTTTLEILDRGGRVALVEKEATLGGNSRKASSGINGCCQENHNGDSLEAFQKDTTKSAGRLARPPLIEELVTSSASALQWLHERVGVDLSQVAQLGGHSFPRTHRPALGMIGAELIAQLEKLVRSYVEEKQQLTILTTHSVKNLVPALDGKGMAGVEVVNLQTNKTQTLHSTQVVLATGGFASDRRANSLLSQVRPDLVDFGTTGGSYSTGDGIALGTSIGAKTIDLDQIQLHPTGFVDPLHPEDPTKVLAAELLRGMGGLLLHQGRRFCNELGTRDYVTKQMLATANAGATSQQPTFTLLLTEEAALQADKHVALYSLKRLLKKVEGLDALAKWMDVPVVRLVETFQDYEKAKVTGKDVFGKTVFKGLPSNWDDTAFYVGTVTPVLHYCMGGLSINTNGQVLKEDGVPITGLYAAGEVTGGVHGQNRLGGNSLLECTVYGRKIGRSVFVQNESTASDNHKPRNDNKNVNEETLSTISWHELETHSSREDLWMAVNGLVYNLTRFAKVHPGGSSILESLAGGDASEAFATVHSPQLLPGDVVVGRMDPTEPAASATTDRFITLAELKQHSSPEDCWVVFHGQVYDMTDFSKTHKGGAYLIQKYAGKDATDTFKVFHKKDKLALVSKYRVGLLASDEKIDT
ncbi:Succinate dehydrogenase [ubiquinone] flavoprotein subunit, mitochondrial [Seminavis robusta]|uniref:Succinate dehydrogenase [ubiquinone] flavoprotein subunit, mitochondrial n=1 Tax=Seminavis robusta TaxID=568900 RepID=A0A9N8DEW1_9STRA|nr:Succinate dehydrogenase [ubiquinone] flavoprotein subunit, mitochondrial [Seminavis robusta]|eukprot:Sro85_g045120.1 Succinate dehydrogenase [ubiquinone] flavoprotein subunit, mitochondrial (762) ;mRNA; f:5211-7496